MKLTVFADERTVRTPDGAVWTFTAHTCSTWQRHLGTFEAVQVVARVREAAEPPNGWRRADGPGVSVHGLPHYHGPLQYARSYRDLRRAVRDVLARGEAVALRVPNGVAPIAYARLRDTGRPYGVHVIGDPHDSFAAGSNASPLRPVFRAWYTSHLRRQCASACAALYVTSWLERRYPCPGFSVTASDVSLDAEAFARGPRRPPPGSGPLTLIAVGTLDQLYKAPDLVIDALALCVRQGLDLRLVLVGDGKYRRALEERAEARGVRERVAFRGMVAAGAAVRAEIDAADLFVHPSKTDAMPKALLEAMARGLPCLGSTVGGIPELLDAEDLVPPGSAEVLAAKIREMVGEPARLARMAARNLERARDYGEETLQPRRTAFDSHLKELTESWLRNR